MKRMDFNLYLFLAVAILLLTVAWVMAQAVDTDSDGVKKPSEGTSPFQSKFDMNSDGQVTKEEWQSGWSIIFDATDKNADQYIDQTEVGAMLEKIGNPAFKAGKLEERFTAMDANGDGKVSQSEWKGPEQVFPKLDQNHDGSITSDELANRSFERKPGSRVQQMDTDGDGQVSASEWKGPEFAFSRLDANRDEKLSQEELAAAPNMTAAGNPKPFDLQASFDSIDTDKDKRISKTEINAWSENEFTKKDTNQDNVLTELDRSGFGKRPFGKGSKKSF